jgi:Phage protein Gp138 N-terminal domain
VPYDRSIAEVLNAHGDGLKDEIRKCLPATVTAVHPDRQTVDVQISVQNPLFDEYGAVSFEILPSIADVPLGVMRGGGFLVWIPVQVGDSVLLIWSDLSMDAWRASIAGSGPVQPLWAGKHTADSPVAIPCVAPDASFFADPSNAPNDVIIGKDGTQAQVRLSANAISLGATGSDHVALASLVASELANIASTFTMGKDSNGAPITFLPVYTPGNIASTLVKAQ